MKDSKNLARAAANVECFVFTTTINEPTPGQATDPNNYSKLVVPKNCPIPNETLCAICIDTEQFPLVNDLPDFANQPILRNLITTNMPSLTPGVYTETGGTRWVELDFRPIA